MNRGLAGLSVTAMDEIRREFHYSAAEDARVARLLSDWLAPPAHDSRGAIDRARRILHARPAVVVGAADSALAGVQRTPPQSVLVAADGATTAVLEAGRRPDLIVTDLDGAVEDELQAATEGSLVFIHAHGDNEAALRTWFSRFPRQSVAGTCQTTPPPRLINPGGFTDGDRACYLAAYLGATRLRLVGFDLIGPIGRYSGQYDPNLKRRKMEWASRLLQHLRESGTPIDFS